MFIIAPSRRGAPRVRLPRRGHRRPPDFVPSSPSHLILVVRACMHVDWQAGGRRRLRGDGACGNEADAGQRQERKGRMSDCGPGSLKRSKVEEDEEGGGIDERESETSKKEGVGEKREQSTVQGNLKQPQSMQRSPHKKRHLLGIRFASHHDVAAAPTSSPSTPSFSTPHTPALCTTQKKRE